MGGSRWVGGKSFKSRKKKNQGWHRDRKENPISAPSIHVGALVGAGSLALTSYRTEPISLVYFSVASGAEDFKCSFQTRHAVTGHFQNLILL